MSKQFLLVLIACVLGLGGVFWFTRDKKSTTTPPSNSSSQGKLSNNVYGKGTKNVKLVEYGDFQCPACGQFFSLVQVVKQKYQNEITFQFRHFPLVQIHKNAMAAHRSAESAAKQGKFWEMHDMLYQQQENWSESSNATKIFESFAQQLGLDMQKYKQDFSSSEINDIINADQQEGQRVGVSSTPTFYLNDKKIDDPPKDVEGFSKLIDEAIKNSQNKQ